MKITTGVILASIGLVSTEPPPQIPIQPSPPTSDPIAEIPLVGLGLWNTKGHDATHAVKAAFNASYHHLDSAAAYGNEKYVGKGLHANHTPARHEYWITSKLWNTQHRPDHVVSAFNRTLADLNTTYLDLYLMHWPVAFRPDSNGRTVIDQDVTVEQTWKAMEILASAYEATSGAYGARHIGISNFSPRQLDQILKICTICPYAHEFETHPYLQQSEFVDWHARHNIRVIAYSPLANLNPTYRDTHPDLKPILEDEFWVQLARRKNCTVAQAVLAWGIARGTPVIPKSTHPARIRENILALNVTFSKEEMGKIADEDKKARFNDPGKDWGVELFEGLDGAGNRFITGRTEEL